MERLYRSLRRKAAAIDWADAERRHRVRIRLKRLRYGCDCFATAYSRGQTAPLLHRLRALQELLGELNDIQVQRRLLGDLARDERAAAPAQQARRELAARERELICDVAKAWSRFEAMPPYWGDPAGRARG